MVFARCGHPSFSLCPPPFLPRDCKQREGSQENIKQGLLLWIMSWKKKCRRGFYGLKTLTCFKNPSRGTVAAPYWALT